MKSFQYLTILMVAIVTIEAQFWSDSQWQRWEWMNFGAFFTPYPGRADDLNKAKEAGGQRFELCDKDGVMGLTWDELKDCEVSFSLS